MRLIKLAALVGVGFLSVTTLFAATPQETFNAVINRYSEIRSIKADFTEQICYKKDGTCQELKGSFFFVSPDKFRLDVTVPMEQLVVSNGETVWIYVPSASQAVKTKPGPEQEIFLFVARLKNYSETYTVSFNQTKEWLEVLFTAKPDKKVFLKQFVMLINPARNDLAGIKLREGDTEMVFLLGETTFNANISNDKFTFNPPEGTTIIKDTGTGYNN